MNIVVTPKENAALHALLTVVTGRMTDKKAEGIPLDMLSSVLSKLEAPEREDVKTMAALKRALGSTNVKSESFSGSLMAQMYENTRLDEAMPDSEIKNMIKSLDSATVNVGVKKNLKKFVGKVPEDTYAFQNKFPSGSDKDTDWLMIRGKDNLDMDRVKGVTKMSDMKEQSVNEQGDISLEIYKQGKSWYLRGLTNVEALIMAQGIDALWRRGEDKDGIVFMTDDDDIAIGTANQLGMIKKDSQRFGATEYYSK